MLLPDKHVRLSESILGLSALVLSYIPQHITFDALWNRVRKHTSTPDWPATHGVENFSLALCFLFSIQAIDVSEDGELFRCG